MSKYPNLMLFGSGALGAAAIAVLSVNLADRNIVALPENPDTVPLRIAATSAATEEAASRGSIVASAEAATDSQPKLGLGRAALPEEIAAWDLDVLPDGRGLPEGSGDVFTGEEVFAEKCASCHGDFAEGLDNWPSLAGGQGTLADADPVKTVGSYWPYLSTVWDYVHRSMPFGAAQTLSADETYAITAYILYSNDLVGDDFTLSHENFLDVDMPNADGFVIDDREETEYPIWRTEPCMENCKEGVEITMRSSVLGVTPEEPDTAPADQAAEATEEVPKAEAPDMPAESAEAPSPTDGAAPAEQATAPPADLDPQLVADGEKAFRKCKACHEVGSGARNRSGPALNGIVGRTIGTVDGFRYSKPMEQAGESGQTWDDEALRAFIAKPRDFMAGTKMTFPGIRKAADIDAIIAFLKSHPEE